MSEITDHTEAPIDVVIQNTSFNNNDSGNNGFEREDRSRVDSSAFNYRHSRGATRRRRTARRALAHAQRNSLAVDILNVNGTDEEREPTVESEEPTSQEDENDYLSLQDKIDKSRRNQRNRSNNQVNATRKELFIHVQWPKIKRKLILILKWEAWGSNLKYINGKYGSAVASYFTFLRWLFFQSLLISLIMLLLVIIPQFAWRNSEEGLREVPKARSRFTMCIATLSSSGENLFNMIMNNECQFACVAGNDVNSSIEVIKTKECRFGSASGSRLFDAITMKTNLSELCPNVTGGECLLKEIEKNKLCNVTSDPIAICPDSRDGFQFVLDFFTGEGIFEDSELFIGWYTNGLIRTVTPLGSVTFYDLPVVYLLTSAFVYILSLLLILIRIGKTYHDHYTRLGSHIGKDVCKTIFTAWDFNFSDGRYKKGHHKALKRKLAELAGEVIGMSTQKSRNIKEWIKIVAIRIATNSIIIIMLIAGGVALYYTVEAEIQRLDTNLISTALIQIMNIVFPFIFGLLTNLEQYSKPNHAVIVSLFRVLLVRLFSYISLIGFIFIQIGCTQTPNEENQCSTDDIAIPIPGIETETCASCWETVVGQNFYSNAIVFLFVVNLGTIFGDAIKNALSRLSKWMILHEKIRNYLRSLREFEVPDSIADLFEIQIIFWLGFFYAPLICLIATLTLLILFYVKKYSMRLNLRPPSDYYQASTKDFAYSIILFILGLICLVPVVYAIIRLTPSANCGPFRDMSLMYEVILERVETFDCNVQAAIKFFLSYAFLLPIILILAIVCLSLLMHIIATRKSTKLLAEQLKLESEHNARWNEVMLERFSNPNPNSPNENDIPSETSFMTAARARRHRRLQSREMAGGEFLMMSFPSQN